jgi:hypothetical protein
MRTLLDHVRAYECLPETPSEIEESLDAQKREFFPLSLFGKAQGWNRCFGRDYLTWENLEQLIAPNSSRYDVSSH